jgi:23S rRNA (guanosine2251-2'-O)-methyltransferase
MSTWADEHHGRGGTSIVVYGRRAVREAIEAEHVEVRRVLVSTRTPASYRKDLRAHCREAGIEFIEGPEREVATLSGDPRNDQGVAASVVLGLVQEAEQFLESKTGVGAGAPTRLIALDGVTNPQNVGMIVRSAIASGMAGVLWPSVGSPWISGLVIKASAGVVYRCPIVRCGELVEGLWAMQAAGFSVFGLDAGDDAENLFEHEPAHRAVYVVGSEAEGLSEVVRGTVDGKVAIPMRGGVESLNAAVAASLVCFTAMK